MWIVVERWDLYIRKKRHFGGINLIEEVKQHLPWKLTVDFDTQRQLFSNTTETEYEIDSYSCSCGKVDFIVKDKKQELNYICSDCQNSYFYDANLAYSNKELFVCTYKDIINYSKSIVSHNKNTISAKSVIMIPKDIDFMQEKVIFFQYCIDSLEVQDNGSSKSNFFFKIISRIKLEDAIIQYLEKNITNIPFRQIYYMSFERKITFFQINRLVTLRKERSIKKALYTNMIAQITKKREYLEYNISFVEAFLTTIDDPNIVVRLLSLDIYGISQVDLGLLNNKDSLIEFILFLKESRYTEKQLLSLFIDKVGIECFLKDTLNEFIYFKENETEKFTKVPCKIIELHDELVSCTRRSRKVKTEEFIFEYTDEECEKCAKIDNYIVKLPLTDEDLYDLSEEMSNCIYAYGNDIEQKQSIIYSFYKENKISFAVEISNNIIIQASGKYNTDLSNEQQNILDTWFKQFFNNDGIRNIYMPDIF